MAERLIRSGLSKKCSANVYFGGINYGTFEFGDQSFVPMMPSTFGGGNKPFTVSLFSPSY